MNIVSLTYSSNENLREKTTEVHKMAKKKKINLHLLIKSIFYQKGKATATTQNLIYLNIYGGNIAQSVKPQSRLGNSILTGRIINSNFQNLGCVFHPRHIQVKLRHCSEVCIAINQRQTHNLQGGDNL